MSQFYALMHDNTVKYISLKEEIIAEVKNLFINGGAILKPEGIEEDIFDGIFSNPPYIPTKDIGGLLGEVKHEPRLALDGGTDGLYFYHLLAKGAAEHLKPGGFLAAEFGIGQATDILEMFRKSAQYEDFEVIKDYGGIERALYCRKK